MNLEALKRRALPAALLSVAVVAKLGRHVLVVCAWQAGRAAAQRLMYRQVRAPDADGIANGLTVHQPLYVGCESGGLCQVAAIDYCADATPVAVERDGEVEASVPNWRLHAP